MTQPYVLDLGDYEVNTDSSRIDFDRVEALIRQTYWAAQRPRDQIERALSHSVLFGAYRKNDGLQVGFCRVVTDFVSFGWLADVIVDEAYRGHGIGKALMQAVVEQPELTRLPLALSTADAQGLYEQFGFTQLPRPQQWMLRADASSPSLKQYSLRRAAGAAAEVVHQVAPVVAHRDLLDPAPVPP